MTDPRFYVIGSRRAGVTGCGTTADSEAWYGPFADYATAKAEWQKHHRGGTALRYRIEHVDPDQPPPGTD